MADERTQRRLAAILAADVVGYSRLMEQDEAGTLAALADRRKAILEPLFGKYRGRVVRLMGDGTLAEFASAVDAVQCAVDIQKSMKEANAKLPEDRAIILRVGLNLGDVVVEDGDLYGDGVNVAARLEAMADPGGICLSAAIHQQVERLLPFAFRDLGDQALTNIARAVRVYRIADNERMGDNHGVATPTGHPLVAQSKPSVAVLPFVNMSGDPDQEYFSDGITEDIISGLSLFRELMVIARTSSFSYKGRVVPVPEIARELGVAYILEGSVRRSGTRVRITAQLVEGAKGEHLWAERYDRDVTDVFAAQDEITDAVVGAIVGRLGRLAIDRARRKLPASLTALELFLQGRDQVHRYSPDSLAKARVLLEAAIRADAGYAAAYAWLAETHWAAWWAGWTANPADSFARAAELADRAVNLEETDPHAQMEKGQILLCRRRYDEARFHLGRAAQLNRYDPDVITIQAFWALFAGDLDYAVAKVAEITRLDPLGHYGLLFGMIHYARRDYQRSIASLKTVRGSFPSVHAWLAASYGMGGDHAAARAAAATYIAEATAAAKAAGCLIPPGWREFLQERHPFAREPDMTHFLDGLERSGIV
jgi:TolB-like protein